MPRSVIGVITCVCVLACACASSPASGQRVRVVTAFYPIAMAAERIGGDLVDVIDLTPPGTEPHDLELKPSDVRALRGASVILYFADGFQPALENAIAALPDRRATIDLLAGLPVRAPEKGESQLTADPHVWLSPPLMRTLVASIARALEARLPADADELRARTSALDGDVAALDVLYRTRLRNCARHEIFTSHAAFAYLADRYGLTQVAIEGLSPDTEPSARRLQAVASRARAAHATTIFFETLVSPRIARTVARVVGAGTAVLDPIEGITQKDADYFSIMRSNLSTLVAALGCAA